MQMVIETTPRTALTGCLDGPEFQMSDPVSMAYSRFHHMQTFTIVLRMI
jgi:hypothetical protein